MRVFPFTFAMLLGSAACSRSGSDAAPKVRPAPMVVAGRVASRDVAVEVSAPVELRPLFQADVGSKTIGYLDAVLVDRGDRVRRGQLIALVRPSDLPDQLAAARGTLAQTQASLALAKTNFERSNALAPSGVVSQQELQSSAAALATATAAEEASKSNVAGLATRLGETRIEAPLDGVVAVRRLDPGTLVGPTTGQSAIFTIVRLDTLRVFITVTEADVRRVKIGQAAHVEMDAVPGRTILGKVVRMAPTLDPTTRTLDAEVQLQNPGEELRPGMFGRGSIVIETHAHAPIVPANAIQITDRKKFVFVIDGDKVRRHEVKTGVDEGTWLEILSGVHEGEEVVVAGMDALSDGVTVRITRDVDPYTGAKITKAAEPVPSPSSSLPRRD